jgi:hypothetical protein
MLHHLRGGAREGETQTTTSPLSLIENPGSLQLTTLLRDLHKNPSYGLTETQVHDRLRTTGRMN